MNKDRNTSSLKHVHPVNLSDEKVNSHLDQEDPVKNENSTKKLPAFTRQATPYFVSNATQKKQS